MSGTERSFVLKYRFKNVSNIKNTKKSYSDYEDHFGVPWRLSIKNNENHLGVHLYCGRSEKEKEWSIDTEYEIHIFHPKENSFHEFTYLLNCFTNAIGRGPSRIMTWERMEKEFLHNDELVVEIRVKINEITGIEDVNLNMPETVDKLSPVEEQTNQRNDNFVLKHVFKNVSKIKEFGCRYGPTEDHSGIPWNILIHNRKDHLEVILYCGRPGNKSEWSVDIEYEIHVLHPNGNPAHKNSAISHRFTEAIRRGPKEIMTWERMEKEFLLNDELAVEICVKIIKMTGAESIVYLNPRPRSFVLKHAFKNVSKMRDTEVCKGPIQYHFIAPWFIGIRNENKHLGVHLYCGRSKNKKEWSIDTELEVHVFHPNGNPVQENSAISHCFAVASGYGPSDLMTWERMEKEFLLNDELVVEIRVTMTNFTGIEGFHLNMSETDDKLSIVEKQTNQKTDNFVLKHVFKNVSTMDDEGCYGPTEDHFGVSWYVFINHEKEHLAVFLRCARSKNKKEWSIDTDFEIHVLHPNGNPVHKSSISSVFTNDFPCGRNLMTWERMEREFLLNDELVVEIRVKIIQMAGIEDFHLNSPLSTFQNRMNRRPRSFVLKHVWKNVSKITEISSYRSLQTYFKVPWCMRIAKEDEHLGVHLCCCRRENKKEWSIDTECEINVFRTNGSPFCKPVFYRFTTLGRCGWKRFMTWERMEEECVANDELVIEIRVKIVQMAGIEEFLKLFNDEEGSDVALVVDGKKFQVSKLYLASQSSYFNAMFFGKFNESEKTEIELTGIDAFDLQKYLEMLYGEDALDDDSVKGILHLADMYDTKTLIQKCEKYLMDVSTIPLGKKFEMSKKYNLSKLKLKTAYVLAKANRSPKTVFMETPSITHL